MLEIQLICQCFLSFQKEIYMLLRYKVRAFWKNIKFRMPFYKQEALPERKDGLGCSFRMRRGKRFVSRITRRRCSILVLISVFLFLVFLSFFSRNLSFPCECFFLKFFFWHE